MILGCDNHQGQEPWQSVLNGMGWKDYRFAVPWSAVQLNNNPDPTTWNWGWVNDAIHKMEDAGARILAGLGTVPPWVDQSVVIVPSGSTWDSIPWKASYSDLAVNFAGEFYHRYPVPYVGLDVETNITRWWPSLDPFEYVESYLIPTSKALQPMGAEIVAPGTTLQGEHASTFSRAITHFTAILRACLDVDKKTLHYIDHLSFHVYRDKGNDVISDIKRFIRAIANDWTHFESDKRRLWITETGFDQSIPSKASHWFSNFYNLILNRKPSPLTGEHAQADKYNDFLHHFLRDPKTGWIDPDLYWIANIYIFSAFGSAGAFLDWKGNINEAGAYLAQYL